MTKCIALFERRIGVLRVEAPIRGSVAGRNPVWSVRGVRPNGRREKHRIVVDAEDRGQSSLNETIVGLTL